MEHVQALIIDDNTNNIDVLVMLLEQQGVAHTAVESVRGIPQALDRAGSVNVIFLDLEFPNGDGFDALVSLKQDERLQGVPIVAYSVHTSEIDRARRAGFHSFLGKPLNVQRFPEQLRLILGGTPVWDV